MSYINEFYDLNIKQKFELCESRPEIYLNHLKWYLKTKTSIGIDLKPNDIRFRNADAYEHYQEQDRDMTRWSCDDHKHNPSPKEVIQFNDTQDRGFFGEVVKCCPKLECVDFRGLGVDRKLVDIIIRFPKSLKCVHFDLMQISVNDWKRLVQQIAPKLEHISIGTYFTLTDNNDPSFDPFALLFSAAKRLKICSIVYYPNSDLISYSHLKKLSQTTIYLAIYNWESGGNNARELVENLTKADLFKLRQFVFLNKIGNSQEIVEDLAKFFDERRYLSDLCLELDLQFHSDYWSLIKNLNYLKDLSLAFHGCKACPDFDNKLKQFESLQVLNLNGIQLDLKGIMAINIAYPNLNLLKLKDCLFIHMKAILEYIPFLEKLRRLHISYSDTAHPKYNFSKDCVESIYSILENSPKLRELSLINLPRLRRQQLNNCFELAKENDVEFYFRQQ